MLAQTKYHVCANLSASLLSRLINRPYIITDRHHHFVEISSARFSRQYASRTHRIPGPRVLEVIRLCRSCDCTHCDCRDKIVYNHAAKIVNISLFANYFPSAFTQCATRCHIHPDYTRKYATISAFPQLPERYRCGSRDIERIHIMRHRYTHRVVCPGDSFLRKTVTLSPHNNCQLRLRHKRSIINGH